ncbi:MAG TPA: SRPBCC family protein [Candidatus Dormibacteraeota bacterium]|nr:SRPBCC family protein [Candidatus Dormibacteraeota bacterium]
MNEFEIATVIDRPPDKVFAFLVNWDRYPDWSGSLSAARKTSEGPLGAGSTANLVGKMLGRGFETSVVVTEYVANERFATKTTSGAFYLEVGYKLESADGKTAVTTAVRGESKGFFKLAEPVMVRVTKKQFETDTESLKALVEGEPK